MADDRPIAPSVARIERAHAAGIRPDARWLGCGIAALVAAVLLASASLEEIGAALSVGEPHADAAGSVRAGLTIWATMVAALVGAAIATRVLCGSLGSRDGRARARLGPVVVRGNALTAAVLTVAAVFATLALLRGVLAGAARSVDASPDGMVAVWTSWGVSVLVATGAVLCAAGLFEVLAWRSSRR
ncbi:MAG: hypothetical protein JKY37_26170, partial [Nannocystaceae bacterium]|nr:hypothetical protein [Nannocystaceae bacterium]